MRTNMNSRLTCHIQLQLSVSSHEALNEPDSRIDVFEVLQLEHFGEHLAEIEGGMAEVRELPVDYVEFEGIR